jgi:calcium/calmodulin-dependent protein kinase I
LEVIIKITKFKKITAKKLEFRVPNKVQRFSLTTFLLLLEKMKTAKKPDDCEKNYKFGRTLGQGTFATVKIAKKISDNSKWAIKIISRSALTTDDEQSLKMEIQIMELTNHPNVVSIKEIFHSNSHVYIVMDLMTGGELFDRIVSKDHYSEFEARIALKQIVTAIKYCHDKNIVHRYQVPRFVIF